MIIPTIVQLKKMNIEQLQQLALSLRQQIISVVKKNGGHLASNLGVVELTIAIHYVFDTPNDKLIFDVGHQCYAHKILTGRSTEFSKLRMFDGISGFPKQAESEYDTFDTGHASTALSLAAGLMRARNLQNQDFNVISLIGDGAFMGGQNYEALNDLGTISGKHLILLNDNNMTITKSGGSFELNDKQLSNLFDSYNIKYFGSVDGHNLKSLIDCFNKIKNENMQIAVRVVTEKGKGYKDAEECPEKFHAVSRKFQSELSGEYAKAFGDTLCEIAQKNKNIVAVTAAMTDSVGLREFSNLYPNRLFDVGICEAHAVTMAVGLAKGGLKPYVSIYSSFLGRAFDQILNEICLTSKPVVLVVDHSGFVDGDGETHQGFYDISYLYVMPNMTIVAPKSIEELKNVVKWSENFDAPLAIRYPKIKLNSDFDDLNSFDNLHYEEKNEFYDKNNNLNKDLNNISNNIEQKTANLKNCDERNNCTNIEFGKWSNELPDSDLIVLTSGAFCFDIAIKVKDDMLKKGINLTLQNALFLKPLDEKYLDCLNGKYVVTFEDNVNSGGFGSAVSNYFAQKNINAKHLSICVENPILKQGTINELCEYCGFTAENIVRRIENFYKKV